MTTPNQHPTPATRGSLAGAVLAWAALLGVGGWITTRHAWSAGAAAPESDPWPASTRPTLLVFLHPHCPCSRVTVAELAWVLDRCPEAVHVRVHFAVPEGAEEGWARTSLWEEAARLPGAIPVEDDGQEARRFGARTSGQILAYAADGRQLFRGGVTAGRGHRGGNPGRDGLLAALRTGTASPASPVFGCPLFPDP